MGSITRIRAYTNIINYRFFRELTALPYIQKIILYGSRARGDNQERSDIDIAIVCPRASGAQWHAVMDIIANADTLLPIDCVRLDHLDNEDELRKNIKKQGIVLYERK